MLVTSHRNIEFTMVCGHKEIVSDAIRGSRQMAEERRNLASMLCSTCVRVLEGWLKADHGQQAYPMDFPVLNGASDAQVRFASDMRLKEFKKYGPIMQTLSKDSTELAKFAWRALYMCFMVTDSRYWLDERKRFNHHVWGGEIQRLMKEPGFSDRVSSSSAYGFFYNSRARDSISYFMAINPACDLQGKNLPLMRFWTKEMFKTTVAVEEDRQAS
ncbi:hypothetical protein [Pseudomonas serbica]|jgi:hypothetical protein|uniref:hypothetical protein n=1 Tax=Pseudomonas serbica TaxID=2965074 RepID=UPI00237B7A71|nr:hypothetical protein [Pseudomonas serbica]